MLQTNIYDVPVDSNGWRTLPSGNRIKLGRNVKIGEHVTFGADVEIEDWVTIGDYVTLSRGCILEYGVDVNNGTVVAEGEVVSLSDDFSASALYVRTVSIDPLLYERYTGRDWVSIPAEEIRKCLSDGSTVHFNPRTEV